MEKNFVIAIGGRGSQILESLVYLCAAGSGPEHLDVLMVDPDASNKNFTRTNCLIETYQKIAILESCANEMFSTKIEPQGKEARAWSYISPERNSLKKILGEPSNDTGGKYLRKLFFTEEELNLDLKEGFKGHPVIGATIFGSVDIEEEVANKEHSGLGRMVYSLHQALSNNSCRLFFIGSLFGGTGAAGLPNLVRKILDYLKKEKSVLSNLYIGGDFIAPYFTFKASGPSSQNTIYAKAELFLMNTKAVLANYDILVRGIYNTIHLIGEQDWQEYDSFSTGGSTQNNKPHYVELVAAVAALDFFRSEIEKNISNDHPNIIMWARPGGENNQGEVEQDALTWGSIGDGQGIDVTLKNNLTRFTMFYMAYIKLYKPRLDRIMQGKSWRSFWGNEEPFYTEKFKKDDPQDRLDSAENIEALKNVEQFFTGGSEEGGYGYNNWLDAILKPNGRARVELLEPEFDRANNIYKLDPEKETDKEEDEAYTELYSAFREAKPVTGFQGARKFINLLFKAVDLRFQAHYLKSN